MAKTTPSSSESAPTPPLAGVSSTAPAPLSGNSPAVLAPILCGKPVSGGRIITRSHMHSDSGLGLRVLVGGESSTSSSDESEPIAQTIGKMFRELKEIKGSVEAGKRDINELGIKVQNSDVEMRLSVGELMTLVAEMKESVDGVRAELNVIVTNAMNRVRARNQNRNNRNRRLLTDAEIDELVERYLRP